MPRPLRIVITTGDPDGIGLEVASKALCKLGPQARIQFYMWRSAQDRSRKYLDLIDRKFTRIPVASWHEALSVKVKSHRELIDIRSGLSPAHWVETSARASLYGHVDGLVTAPLSKTLIQQAGFSAIGHTEILSQTCQSQQVFMGFIGREFNVVLATGHTALKSAAEQLNEELLKRSILAANELRKLLPAVKRKKPMALVGINPHAGEGGLIGREEAELIQPMIGKFPDIPLHPRVLVPDAAFLKENWNLYSVYICMYHDQGLIPFKLVHGQNSGIQISLGLPFIRTSVDHGTAKDIFGRNKANPNSMIEAIDWAIQLSQQKISTEYKEVTS